MTDKADDGSRLQQAQLDAMRRKLLADSRRVRHVRLAHMRQELLAPVNAIVGFSEMLREEGSRRGLDAIVPDLDRILTSARDLFGIVDRLLDEELARELFEDSDEANVQKGLRHDLRIPIHTIKGYSELLLEDADETGCEPLVPDFMKLLAAADRLFAQIDTIVDFTRVGVDLPAAASDEITAMLSDVAQSVRPVDEGEAGTATTGRILVVDDNQSNRELLERQLTREGHRVVAAEDGRGALEMLEAGEFDLVLLDLIMPGLNGFEVLSRIKADARLREIPVIMVSAFDDADSMIRCIGAGAEDYLAKPINSVLLKARITTCLEKKRLRDRERLHLEQLATEKTRNEKLLLNILPRRIIERLNEGETMIADRHDEVTVLFADLVGFVAVSARMQPSDLVAYLNRLYSEFDALARDLAVEKIKMIGDTYMVAAGLPEPRTDHANAIANMGLGMIDVLQDTTRGVDYPFDIRIGIHSGPVVAGIIGTHRFLYDVWGETVNIASRLETTSLPNRIQLSSATVALLSKDFDYERRGSTEIKGIGELETFFLNGPRATGE